MPNSHLWHKFFSESEMALIARKGFYPYEFIDDHTKLNYPGLPPPKKAFILRSS